MNKKISTTQITEDVSLYTDYILIKKQNNTA